MNIYIDFDDCLCETALYFTKIVKELFGKDIPYKDIKYFDLQKSFSLSDEEYNLMMEEGHTQKSLLSFAETKGASEVVNGWLDEGHKVSVITGRPLSAYDTSRQWLNEHNLSRVELYCLNKYGRDSFIKNSEYNLEVEDYLKMKFDFAVEDSPGAFKFLTHLPRAKVAVFDRPWNRECDFPKENFVRCVDWESIDREFIR